MQQNLLTEVYGLIFLLVIVGSLSRSWWRRSKRTGPGTLRTRTPRQMLGYLFRLVMTSAVAWVVAVSVADETAILVWILLWLCLYWLWKFWDRWQAKGVAQPALKPTPSEPASQPQPLPADGGPRPLWRRLLRKTATLAAGMLVLIVGMAIVLVLGLGYYQRQVKAARDKIHIGMTVKEVLPLVHGALNIRAHAVLPENVSDEEGVHYASLRQLEDGRYDYFGAPADQSRQLADAEVAALMRQKMSDGYEWRWRYTFVNDTPMHFSFTVTFGRDGRVKDVTDVWGWD